MSRKAHLAEILTLLAANRDLPLTVILALKNASLALSDSEAAAEKLREIKIENYPEEIQAVVAETLHARKRPKANQEAPLPSQGAFLEQSGQSRQKESRLTLKRKLEMTKTMMVVMKQNWAVLMKKKTPAG